MQLQIFSDYQALSLHTAQHIVALLNQKPVSLICVASGDTPTGVYRELVRLVNEGAASVAQCMFVGLDEWVGLGPENRGSCAHYLNRELFYPLGIGPDQFRLFDALAPDLDVECDRMNEFVVQGGGFDLMLVGLGMNGHIALNEPGTPFTTYAHVADLAETTITVGQKYFSGPTVLQQGITLGLQHLLDAKEAILLASGAGKAPVIKTALTGPVTEAFPASILQRHPNGLVWLDAAAGAEVA